MKTNPRTRRDRAAFTRKDLLAVMTILLLLLVLARVLLPAWRGVRAKPIRISCVNNQKQIAMAFRMFASDNNGRYPLQTTNHPYIYPPGRNGTAAGAVVSTSAQPWQVFQSMWNELQSPMALLCPQDTARNRAAGRVTDFKGLADAPGPMTSTSLGHPDNQNLAVSYAVQAMADESRPLGLLTLDRRINWATATAAPTTPPATSGSRLATTSEREARSVFWVGEPWPSSHYEKGVLSLADGSVQQADQRTLTEALLKSGTSYGWGTATSNGFGAAIFLLP